MISSAINNVYHCENTERQRKFSSAIYSCLPLCHIRSLARERAAFRLPTMWPVSCRRLLSKERLESKEFQFIDEIVISWLMITVQVIPYMPKPLVMEPSWRPIILANDQVQGTHSHRHHTRGPKTWLAGWHCHPESLCASGKFLHV